MLLFSMLAAICYRNPKAGIRWLALLTPFWIEFKFPSLSGVRIGYVDVIVVSALLALWLKRRDPGQNNKIGFLLLFIGYNVFTLVANMPLFEEQPADKGIWMVYKLISFNLLYPIVIKHASDERTVFETVKCFLFASVMMAFLAVLQRPLGNQFNLFAFGTYADDLKFSLFHQDTRVIGTLRSPNELAGFLLWPLCIMTGIWLNYNGRRFLLYLSLLVMILALLLTYSRTGWIAYLLSFSLICILCKRKSLLVGICAILLCAVFILPQVVPGFGGTFVNRLTSINKREDDLAMIARNERWEYYSQQVMSNPWGLGVVPTGTFSEAASPHNNFLYLSLMSGIPGMVCAMLMLAGTVVTAYRNYLSATDPVFKGIFAGIFAAGGGFILHSFLESLWQNFQMGVLIWLLFGITIAYHGILRRRHEDLAGT